MKISELKLYSFRGIPNECHLSFTDRNGVAVSSIIYGGNGSGKSSIVDALEFSLQGRIERSMQLKNNSRPMVVNLSNSQINKSSVEVVFDNGERCLREIVRGNDLITGLDTIECNNTDVLPSFSWCPVALRRNDLFNYSYTPKVNRQLLLFQFIYSLDTKAKLKNDPEIKDLENRRLALKQKRKELVKVFNEELPSLLEKPNNMSYEAFIRSHYWPLSNRLGFTKRGRPKHHIPNLLFSNYIEKAKQIDLANNEISKLQSEINYLLKSVTPDSLSKLQTILQEASGILTSSFKSITFVDYIDDINVAISDQTAVSLSINIKLKNGIELEPNQIFSEANYDLMILLLYLSLIRVSVRNGQEKILILDDVLQSVDANIRSAFILYILNELKDWQFFITCHDRLWLSQLKHLFNNASHRFKEYHIGKWSFTNGPIISEGNYFSVDNSLKQAIAIGDIRIIAATAGLILEKICQGVSCSINSTIERKPEDKYTIGDLWPGIMKKLRNTDLSSLLETINNLLYIRNLLGCHYNQWAESLSDAEVQNFANAVQELYERTYCNNCNCWIYKTNTTTVKYECRCRRIQY